MSPLPRKRSAPTHQPRGARCAARLPRAAAPTAALRRRLCTCRCSAEGAAVPATRTVATRVPTKRRSTSVSSCTSLSDPTRLGLLRCPCCGVLVLLPLVLPLRRRSRRPGRATTRARSRAASTEQERARARARARPRSPGWGPARGEGERGQSLSVHTQRDNGNDNGNDEEEEDGKGPARRCAYSGMPLCLQAGWHSTQQQPLPFFFLEGAKQSDDAVMPQTTVAVLRLGLQGQKKRERGRKSYDECERAGERAMGK